MTHAKTSLVLLVNLGLVLAACSGGRKKQSKLTDGPNSRAVVDVEVRTVSPRTFTRVLELEGTLDPAERILVAPSVPGMIRKVTKRAGDPVKKGELLVVVDPKEVYVGTIGLRVHLATARSKARAADAVLSRLAEPLERLRRLYRAKAISKTDLDKVEIPYVRARAERDAARAIIGRVKGELGIAYSKLSDTKITAPFDGFVVRRLADPGEVARPFPPTVVLVITRHDPLYVQAELNEEDIGRISRGQQVTVACDALAHRPPVTGVLEEIIPYVNPMTRTVTIRVRVDNKSGQLMPGMSATLKLTLKPRRALAVPRGALATAPFDDKVSVFVLGADERVREKILRFGRSQDEWVSVLGGLSAGDRVVVKGHERLYDRSRVRVVNREPAARAPRPAPKPASRAGIVP